ncbi:hypothetical protein HaLaN_03913, partial [Haematococcus lacustris]
MASGGFHCRSEREVDVKSTTGKHVGPGSYELAGEPLPASPTGRGPAPAPFMSRSVHCSSQPREKYENISHSAQSVALEACAISHVMLGV